jgi:hypothetical protein
MGDGATGADSAGVPEGTPGPYAWAEASSGAAHNAIAIAIGSERIVSLVRRIDSLRCAARRRMLAA